MNRKVTKLVCFFLTSIYTLIHLSQVYSAEIVTQYTIQIEVSATKSNGKSWDAAGGAPDIMFKLENRTYFKNCKNTYKCKMSFHSKNSNWYFEIYDKDVGFDDLIGKGECKRINRPCNLDQATVIIE